MSFTVKRERKYRYVWHEYLLFSPQNGQAVLSENDGNWIFLKPFIDHPWMQGNNHLLKVKDDTFSLYAKFRADVLFCSGEYFHDIVDLTDSSLTYEHISPPLILTFETNKVKMAAFLGEHINRKSVASAFKIDSSKLPKKKSMGYVEPLPVRFKESALIALTLVAIVLATIMMLILNEGSSNKTLLSMHFDQKDLNDQKMFRTSSFDLDDGHRNLEVQVFAPVSNDWFYAEYSLINERTEDEYVFTHEIEYYYGIEEGTSWTEGSKNSEAFLSSIPGGRYHINIYPEFSLTNHEFSISVIRDVPFYSNYFFTVFLFCLFPICFYWYKNWKEKQRWADSDYSPYHQDE